MNEIWQILNENNNLISEDIQIKTHEVFLNQRKRGKFSLLIFLFHLSDKWDE